MTDLLTLAFEWRKSNGYIDKGGVIVLLDYEIQGWVDLLRNPEHWEPGCIAITEDGTLYKAIGGNSYDGADRWQILEKI
ncbi:hypothetical protein MNBD_GAMMA11-3440 [hydrothermal vent metagenome]|uniref:Uncharacterized protein n=1 Tax=hydrothermal vent metagenome TaxID=652676 RepID=A0A3B0XP26_9ZZZZ